MPVHIVGGGVGGVNPATTLCLNAELFKKHHIYIVLFCIIRFSFSPYCWNFGVFWQREKIFNLAGLDIWYADNPYAY